MTGQSFPPPGSTPIPSYGVVLEQKARTRGRWAIVCWVLFGVMILGILGQLGSGGHAFRSANGAELAGMLIAFAIMVVIPLVIALRLGAVKNRLLEQAAQAYAVEAAALGAPYAAPPAPPAPEAHAPTTDTPPSAPPAPPAPSSE